MKEWIKEQQRRYLDEPRLKELTEVMKQTRVLVRKRSTGSCRNWSGGTGSRRM